MPKDDAPDSVIDYIFASFNGLFTARDEVFQKAPAESLRYRQRLREESEARKIAETTIAKKYWSASFELPQLEARAKARGVKFLPMATGPHQAAILDFLDDPSAPTPLNSMHMTWFIGVTLDGKVTMSRTHPVNRAIYDWSARHFASLPPYDHPSADAALKLLTTQQFPIERARWTNEQWLAFERTEQAQRISNIARQFRPTLRSSSL